MKVKSSVFDSHDCSADSATAPACISHEWQIEIKQFSVNSHEIYSLELRMNPDMHVCVCMSVCVCALETPFRPFKVMLFQFECETNMNLPILNEKTHAVDQFQDNQAQCVTIKPSFRIYRMIHQKIC